MPVVLVVLKQKGGEGSSKALSAVIVQTSVSFHQPSQKEHSGSNFLLHGDTLTEHSKLKPYFKKIISSDKTHPSTTENKNFQSKVETKQFKQTYLLLKLNRELSLDCKAASSKIPKHKYIHMHLNVQTQQHPSQQ